MKYDIITFGSAARDVYLISKKFLFARHEKFTTGRGLCLTLGSKVEIDNLLFRLGGGGINTATTFANQGFKSAFCGMVGRDIDGTDVIKEMMYSKISTEFLRQTGVKPTNYSLIIASPGTDRTILAYRGASGEMDKKDIPWKELDTKWFYLSPLSGKICDLTLDLIDFAKKRDIKVAFNPGECQLSFPAKTLQNILKKVDVLILNQEEASILTKIPYNEEEKIFAELDKMVRGIVIMTKGEEGVVLSDGKYLYSARSPRIKVLDRTGAGDAFGSGFVSGFLKKGTIEEAIQLGTANAIACLKSWGAKEGLLKEGQKWQRVKVQKKSLK